MNTQEVLNAGRELFNQGQYFQAHEVWEDAWRVETGETRQLLQALIQVAAGCHKASLNEPRGTVKLLASAVVKMVDLPVLAGFRDKVLDALAIAQRWEQGGPPYVPHLQLDQRF